METASIDTLIGDEEFLNFCAKRKKDNIVNFLKMVQQYKVMHRN